MVGKSEPWLQPRLRDQPVILIHPEAGVDSQLTEPDGIGGVERILIDVVGAAERKFRASARQIVGHQAWKQAWVCDVSGIEQTTLRRIRNTRQRERRAQRAEANRIERRVGDPQREVFRKPGLLNLHPKLQGMVLVSLCDIRSHPPIREEAVFRLRRRSIVERISAAVIVHLVAAREEIDS